MTILHNFCTRNDHATQVCRRCLKTCRGQKQLKNHWLRCIKKEVRSTSCRHPNQKTKYIDWHVKKDPPMWIAADFECLKKPVDDRETDSTKKNSL